MGNDPGIENVRALLNLRMQDIQRWSELSNRITGYIIALNIGVWSFFLKEFMDVINQGKTEEAYSLLVLVAALSALTIGVWRWYYHNIMSQEAFLIPEIMRYELTLSVPYNEGTSGYLYRNKRICRILSAKSLSDPQKLEVIKKLAKSRQLGLDTKRIDMVMFCLFLLAWIFTIVSWCQGQLKEYPWPLFNIHVGFIGALGILVGLCLLGYTFCVYKKEPSEKEVNNIISDMKSEAKIRS